MSHTRIALEHVCNRVREIMQDTLGDRLYRFDGVMRDFVLDQGLPSGKMVFRYGILQASPVRLAGSNKPRLISMDITLDLVVTGITASNRGDKHREIDDAMDFLSQIFTPGLLDDDVLRWSLADKNFKEVIQGPIIPNVSTDYISRGFQLTLKVLV